MHLQISANTRKHRTARDATKRVHDAVLILAYLDDLFSTNCVLGILSHAFLAVAANCKSIAAKPWQIFLAVNVGAPVLFDKEY